MNRILVFDLSSHIHLPSYLRFLIEHWRGSDLAAELNIVVWHTFSRSHADVVRLAREAPRRNIRFLTITEEERCRKVAIEEGNTGVAIEFAELMRLGPNAGYAALYDWELFCRYAGRTNATCGFIVHIDRYLPLLASGAAAPLPVAGIYFGPSFHYREAGLAGMVPAPAALRQKFVLARALRHPGLNTLFFLDPFAAERARLFPHGEKAVYLADPVTLEQSSPDRVDALRAELAIEPNRRTFLLFGHLTQRKGVGQVLEAVRLLPPGVSRRICLFFAGAIDPRYQATLDRDVSALRAAASVQVVTRYGFIPHADVAACFQLADVILAPYQRHAGMSGILLLAAASRKPVLSSDYGLMGEIARRHQLGLTVDASAPERIAEGLRRFATENPLDLCDPSRMDLLAERHQADRFGATIFRRLNRFA
ncbi:MAG: glycosyltransferase family 4 protein [Bryobacteraceae bacterium]|nr:glycosyltransferase family 4 protein [Bryobacteraceae bacterium]